MTYRNLFKDTIGFRKPFGSVVNPLTSLIFTLLGLFFFSACLPLPSQRINLSSETPIPPTPSPSPTIDWFPATPTTTQVLTIHRGITPSPNTPLEYGEAIFRDDFSQASQWKIGTYPDGRISMGANELSLTVTIPRGYVFSLLDGFTKDNYFLEITASPTICRGKDEYGVLLRMSSTQDFYRFALMCDGHARLDRILNGQASATIPPVLNGAVPPGAPSSSHLGIFARDGELRFYVNGQYLFEIKNAPLLEGGLGLFAHLGDVGSMTVNFSDLTIYSLLK